MEKIYTSLNSISDNEFKHIIQDKTPIEKYLGINIEKIVKTKVVVKNIGSLAKTNCPISLAISWSLNPPNAKSINISKGNITETAIKKNGI